ncbi:unnamed protein product [Pneumocystis jirovecii]|uniref:ATP synthase F(0) complex subunit e, mitochondrial n=2 Tax=Pneumocystis jirovecii TaxID=42068 RepID=L0P7Y7_PNEJI|nr:uncharacterized protein T551_03307 [Pneumocystis jirovecii RU7]KTW26845.1 hypothetical protein T551_03307 [Pneumocystis jirovecii RU7]CCJ28501.1 unnamed protein product [Pneumocystis jirovecii]
MEHVALNIFRWSALVAGIGYGYTHRNNLAAKKKRKEEEILYKRKEDIIREAQMEYTKLYMPSKTNILTDPDDPKFDLEAYLNSLESKYSQ